jgi:hypothetical protein
VGRRVRSRRPSGPAGRDIQQSGVETSVLVAGTTRRSRRRATSPGSSTFAVAPGRRRNVRAARRACRRQDFDAGHPVRPRGSASSLGLDSRPPRVPGDAEPTRQRRDGGVVLLQRVRAPHRYNMSVPEGRIPQHVRPAPVRGRRHAITAVGHGLVGLDQQMQFHPAALSSLSAASTRIPVTPNIIAAVEHPVRQLSSLRSLLPGRSIRILSRCRS